jgi:hypothetical protein
MSISTREATVTLNGVTTVTFDRRYPYFAVRNDSSAPVYISTVNADCTAGADGVVAVPKDGSVVIANCGDIFGDGTLYLNGSGTVTIMGQYDGGNRFKVAQKGGETVDINPTSISENHNNIFRGDDLFARGYDINDICAMIADGSFSDIYIGDYFTLSGDIANVPCFVEQTSDDGTKSLVESTQTVTYNTKFRIAGLDTYLNTGDTAFTAHHAVIVPDENIGTNRMNGTNTNNGGYTGSFLFTSVLPVYNAHFDAKLNNHLLLHSEYLTNGVSGNSANSCVWVTVKINLPSEPEIYGSTIFGGKYDNGLNYRQFPIFRLNPKYICNRNWFWCKSTAWNTSFAGVTSTGNANASGASSMGGVRPCFCIG